MNKLFVLDTNVLLHDSDSLYAFEEHDVCIPLEVIGELDKFKRGNEEINVNAREVARTIVHLIESNEGTTENLPLGAGKGKLSLTNKSRQEGTVDEAIIGIVENLSQGGREVCLVTKDLNVYIRASARGIQVQSYQHDKKGAKLEDLFGLKEELLITEEEMAALYSKDAGSISAESRGLVENQYFLTRIGPSSTPLLARCRGGKITPLLKKIPSLFNIQPRNNEQRFLVDACLDDRLTVISALGKAGTGKTLLALAAGLHQVQEGKYDRVIVVRPMVPLGKDLGFLPGGVDEKIDPYFGAVYDGLAAISGKGESILHVLENGQLELLPLTYLQGRNLSGDYLIFDEAQNSTRRETKTLLTRKGEKSKVVMIGDPYQVCNPYLEENDNGLTYYTRRMMGLDFFVPIFLRKTERSREAEIISQL